MLKNILLFILFAVISPNIHAQDKVYEDLYPFDSKYFNLKTLQYENSTEENAESFKSLSKYAIRYKSLVIDKIAYKGMLFQTLEDNGLLLKNLTTKAVTPLPNNEKDVPRQGLSYLLQVTEGIVHVKPLKAENGFMVYKYNETGIQKFGIQIKHSEFVQKGKLAYHLPYLGYKLHTANTIVFSSYVSRIPKTVTLSTLDGSISNFEFSSIGVIRDEANDMDIHGFVQLDKEKSLLNITYISDNFSIEHPSFANITHAETLVKDNTLVITVYNGRAPNAQLLAIDLKTQKIIWEADVPKFGGKESTSYFNAVWLGQYDNKLILEGYEPKGKYLQIFDIRTGSLVWKSF
jgi:hypothetical protein